MMNWNGAAVVCSTSHCFNSRGPTPGTWTSAPRSTEHCHDEPGNGSLMNLKLKYLRMTGLFAATSALFAVVSQWKWNSILFQSNPSGLPSPSGSNANVVLPATVVDPTGTQVSGSSSVRYSIENVRTRSQL